MFQYCSCPKCGLLFIDPTPSLEDLQLMYPASYQQGVNKRIENSNLKQPGLRYPFGKIFSFFRNKKGTASIVDYGCGNGKFIWNALNEGFLIDGVEYGQEQVEKLSDEIEGSTFMTIGQFFESKKKYDIIFLSNVLEHFTIPNNDFKKLMGKLNKDGQVVIEGPLERNMGLINYCKWLYFKMRLKFNSKYSTSFPPVHIFYSNYDNQLLFFENNGLETKHYEVIENSWPYPNSIRDVKTVGDLFKFLIAKLSKFFGLFISRYGNTFLYVGQIKTNNEV